MAVGIKMIVIDLDGTLLRSDKSVSDYTKAVFGQCSARGIKIVFATARPVRTVKSMNLSIPCDAALYHNGAVITLAGAPYRCIGIAPKTVEALLLTIRERFPAMAIATEIDDVLYANFDTSTVWSYTSAVMTDFSNLPNLPADKLIFNTADSGEIHTVQRLLPKELYAEVSENRILMVMNRKATKLRAVAEIADSFAIPLVNTVAFGDDHNDVEMLRACGSGVAVANAIDECKNVADHICDTNDNDGVAKWLTENVLMGDRGTWDIGG